VKTSSPAPADLATLTAAMAHLAAVRAGIEGLSAGELQAVRKRAEELAAACAAEQRRRFGAPGWEKASH
jgi:hypothetical protein